MNLNNKVMKFAMNTIKIIFIIIILFLTSESIFKTCLIEKAEITSYLNDNPFIHIVTISIVIGIFILINKKKINVNKKILWFLIFLWGVICSIVIFLVKVYPVADQWHIYMVSMLMRLGSFIGLQRGRYLFLHPHQSGLILYEYIVGFIFGDDDYLILQIINMLALLVAFFCIYKITRIMFKNKKVSILTILGLFLFLPITFYITFLYGNILGLAFSMIASLFILKYLENRKIKYIIISAISISLSIVFKSNYLINFIAIICVVIMDSIAKKRIKNIIPIVAIIIIYIFIKNLIPFVFYNITGIERAKGVPMIAYIEMGLQDKKDMPGWYNGYNLDVYIKNDYDYDKTVEEIKLDLRNSIKYFIDNPGYMCEFFYKKIVSQWNNPTFQSIWINSGDRLTEEKNELVQYVYDNATINTILIQYMNIIQSIILVGTTIFIFINFKNKNINHLLFIITFIGGFLFHIIWEAKCQYTITYFVLLIPFAVKGYVDIAEKICEEIKSEEKKGAKIMENNIVIRFKKVTKMYKLYKNDKRRFLGLFFKKISYKEKKAVNNVSFDIKKGESVALFGKNGAGKSTILKLITGVTFPTEGEIQVNGRVSALLELTSGFDPEFTGRENIYLKGQILGIKDKEIQKLEPEIIKFAELDDYIDQPVRTYSSGMKARLGFSINANINPEILIIDEALSVGDEEFRRKCVKKVNDITSQKDVTLLFVTHSTAVAKDFCKRGIVMKKGKAVFDGPIDEAIEEYNKILGK